ncbi:MAG: DUF2092 domain-containing protein [Pseudoxanthomonas sp.]
MASSISFLQGKRPVVAAGLCMVLAMPQAWAQSDAAAVEEPADAPSDIGGVVTAEAQAVLDRMTATFRSMRNYSVTASITRDEVLPYGYKLQNTESANMWVEAPTRMRLEVEGDIKNRTYVYDGSKLTMFVPDLNVYAESPAPGTIRELVSVLLDAGVEMPLIDLLYQGAVGDLTDAVKVGLRVGDSEVDGVPTDHLAFRQADVDWQLWVEKGANALPRKLLITTRYEVGDPQYQALLRWNLKPRMAAGAFTFKAPAGAVEIPMQTRLAAEGGAK